MALISPGVSVTVTDQSFFFPTAAATVPLIFVATRANKVQTDGVSAASGTLEANVVRTVTSQSQSLQLYGVPYFCKDQSTGNEFHGDARNEYGLFALNSFLGLGNRAYVVRANVNLNDTPVSFISLGVPVASTPAFVGIGNGTVTGVSAISSQVKPQTITITFTSATTYNVVGSYNGHIGAGIVPGSFTSTAVSFNVTAGAIPFVAGDKFTFALSYAAVPGVNTGNGVVQGLLADALAVPEVITITFTSATAFTVSNMFGTAGVGVVNSPFDDNRLNFTIVSGTTAFAVGDTFTVTAASVTISSPLGVSDAQRRVTIVTALAASINSNVEVRSELYEYNLILCPGYFELADELITLAGDIKDEAFVIADTPCNLNPEQTAQWGLTSARQSKNGIAYYYPWAIQSNLDGRDVMVAASGVALRTMAYSDDQSYVWEAPAGVSRGLTFGPSKVGYVTGDLGTATTFVEANLNVGQRDNMYDSPRNINPITFFPGRGILIWGQKTSSPATSAMDRINVVRGVMYLRRVLRKGAMPFVFEPNDQITRDNLKSAADGLLNDMMVKRGLMDFATYCDATNNTPTVIDNNQLILDVAIKPTRAAEFIYIPIRVVSTSASI
jgi:hypothetical protein